MVLKTHVSVSDHEHLRRLAVKTLELAQGPGYVKVELYLFTEVSDEEYEEPQVTVADLGAKRLPGCLTIAIENQDREYLRQLAIELVKRVKKPGSTIKLELTLPEPETAGEEESK